MAAVSKTGVMGLFRDADGAADAVDQLNQSGFDHSDYEVLTGVPYPEDSFGEGKISHRLYAFPFIGAACGFAVGLLLTAGTQISWPMVTGGKPLLSVPPMIIIMYEGTMLGAILFTVIGIIWESRLPIVTKKLYDTRISEGWIGVVVHNPIDRLGEAERKMRDAGAEEIVVDSPGDSGKNKVGWIEE